MEERPKQRRKRAPSEPVIVDSSEYTSSDDISFGEEDDAHLIYGAVMSDKIMRLSPEEFARFCELRRENRERDDFYLVSEDNEKEPCNREMIQLISGTIRATGPEIDEYRCKECSISAIRLLVSMLYSGIMPTYQTFRRTDFCQLVFRLNIVFLMKFCNSTGVLGTNLMQREVISEGTSSTSDEEFLALAEEDTEEDVSDALQDNEAEIEEEKEGSRDEVLPFVVVDGYKYLFSKRYGAECYYYCQWRRKGDHGNNKTKNYCRASLAVNQQTKQTRYICSTHLESCARVEPSHQREELSIRIQIEQMIEEHMTTTQIHQQLMKLEREGRITIPASVNRTYIERLVRQHQRKSGPVLLKSMFTPDQSKLMDENFIKFECLSPFLLVFATKMSVAAAEVSSEIFVGKVQCEGPDRKRVAVLLYKTRDRRTQETRFKAMAWIIFNNNHEDRDGPLFRATVEYLGWTGNNVRIITSDVDAAEDCFHRSLLNRATLGYMSSVKSRTTKVSYLRKVDAVLKKAQGLPEYNDLRILKDVPDMSSNEISETINSLERLKGVGKRVLLQWKTLFSVKISQISKGQIAGDVGRNMISKWLSSIELPDSWISLLDELKRLHQELEFIDDESVYEEEHSD